MMFDPPDFPYKELTENLTDHYTADELLFTNDTASNVPLINPGRDLAEMTEQMISNVESQLMLQSNDTGRYFNIENIFTSNSNNIIQNTDLYIVQSDNLFDYEPTLLDENTVNQFLLPLQQSSVENKDAETNGPDLLAIHSCTVCHDIFTTESDLLDHTICIHACNDTQQTKSSSSTDNNNLIQKKKEDATDNNNLDFEPDWLVCSICERVLSTALEVEPSELLCCGNNGNGKKNVTCRKLLTMYVCDYCSGLFANGEALDQHKLTCSIPDSTKSFTDLSMNSTADDMTEKECPEIYITCDTCGKQYKSTEELKVHAIECKKFKRDRRAYSSNNNKMWNCGSCNQLFVTARELYRHKRGEDRPPGAPLMAYVCEECDKVLGSMCALHTHKKMHRVTKPGYPCRICGRRFNQSGHLAIHMRMHTGERPYPCDLCPKAFKVKVERDDHRRTHTGERPFACTSCPKTFTAAARLREHARIHTDQRPYRCDICGAAFRRPYARTVHTLIHTGEKPHECDICGTAFRRSGDMWKHKRTLHGIHTANDNETRVSQYAKELISS